MNTVLIQEVIKYIILLDLMKVILKKLKKAFSGKIIMKDELKVIVYFLYNNQVQKVWIRGFLSLKLLMS